MRNLIERVQEYVLRSEEDSYHHVRTGEADYEVVHRLSHGAVTNYHETYQRVADQVDCPARSEMSVRIAICAGSENVNCDIA